jgi:uncharacterized protein YuzE
MRGLRRSQDPRGREVVLTVERWEHITAGHPELEPHQEEVLRAVEAPTETAFGREPDEEWFYPRGRRAQPLAEGRRRLRQREQRTYHHRIPQAKEAMTVTIGDITFDHVEYDADADVLYLHVGEPSRAEDFDETPEGHAVRFDREGNIVGLTLVRPKRLLERDGELRVTLPVPSDVRAEELAPALT